MFFKFEHLIPGASLRGKTPSALAIPGPPVVNVLLEADRAGTQGDRVVATASYEKEPNATVTQVFRSLARGEIPRGGASDEEWGPYTDSGGQLDSKRVLPTHLLPQPARSFVDQVRTELSDAIRRAIRTLRWRQAVPGQHDPFTSRMHATVWSFDGIEWHVLPAITRFTFTPNTVLDVSEAFIGDVESLLADGFSEPLGHELLREAIDLQHSNRRSSLLIGVTALEVGVKQTLVFLAPQTNWLIENLPTPPISRILEEYLPGLPRRGMAVGKPCRLPKWVIDDVKKVVHIRNRLAHLGRGTPSIDDLEAGLLLIRDLLWLFDYLTGHDWAAENIRERLRIDLGFGSAGV